jgi:phosphoserine phosphatase RsbU/P
VPLRSGEYDRDSERRLVGVWALGDRTSHDLFDREDLSALDRIGQQAAVLLDYLRLGREQAQQEVARRELERARAIQQRLLPSTLPGWPGQLDLAARLRPALETSGDFYDVLAVGSADGPQALQLAVADVAGKGIGAALVMALTRVTLRASSDAADAASDWRISYSPAAILKRTGTRLHADVGVSNFVACTLAAFECRSGAPRLRLANAGQVFPLLCRRGQIVELDPGGDRLPLGVTDRPAYADMEVELLPGDVLVFATDGLAEAPRYGHHRGEVFGFERLAASTVRLAQSASSAAEIVDGVWNEMTRWIGGDAEHDDVTLVVARVPPGEGSSKT